MRRTSAVGRVAVMAAVVIAVVGVAVVLLRSGGESYEAKLRFVTAGGLVNGSPVQVAGHPVGSVEQIKLTDEGHAEVTVSVNEDYAPLRRGTKAIIRLYSLSGVANRYIDLQLGPGDGDKIPDGGTLTEQDTTTVVDLDQVFNIFDDRTRRSLQRFIRGFATQYGGRGAATNAGWLYLNPALATTSRFFSELNKDTPLLERFIVESSKLVTDLAEREEDLAGLVDNTANFMGALSNRRTALAEAILRLPDFMRRSNTTFVNLRALLDDLAPLVEESKPVARKLRPFLRDLRGFAADARPTIRDLSAVTRRSGPNNDLIDLTRGSIPLRDVAIGPIRRNGADRQGALPASVSALQDATPELAYARPYGVDLTGWFNDFGTSGIYDALGGASRVGTHVNAFTLSGSATVNPNVGGGLAGGILGLLTPLPPALRQQAFQNTAVLGQNDRCPGSLERPAPDGSNPVVVPPGPGDTDGMGCDPSQMPPGP